MSKISKYLKAMPLIVITAIICILCFTACGEEARERLATPENLRISNEVLMWDEVENATGYEVKIDEQKYQTNTNSLDVFLLTTTPKTYSMRVLAYTNIGKYKDSEWSEGAEYAVEFPAGMTIKAINNGKEYEVVVTDKSAISGKVIIPPYYSDGKYITQICNGAFNGCENLTSVVLPDTITNIGQNAFRDCTSLTRIRLPQYLETIDLNVFRGCENLTEIALPRSVKEIKSNAFNGCKSLTEIYIPDMVEYIGYCAFSHAGITSITVDENNYIYKSDGNCIIEKATDIVAIGCNGSVIPDYVREIKYDAFCGCELLEKIEIPNSVTKIGDNAFNGCSALTEITVPGSVEELPLGMFSLCKSLKKVTLEDGVKAVSGGSAYGGGTFQSCTALESVQLPKTLESISPYAFMWCTSLKSIVIDEENDVLKAEGACIIKKENNELVVGCDYSVVPNYVKIIGQGAFENCSFSRILIKDSEKPDSYYENDNTTLYLPEGLEVIRSVAFDTCGRLVHANLPKSVVKVGESVFRKCYAFSSVIVGENLRSVGACAFFQATVYTSLKSRPYGEYPEGWDDASDYGVFYECEFGEENGQPYLISYTHKRYKDENGVSYCSYYEFGAIRIPCRVGYKFMGFATEEGSDEIVSYDLGSIKDGSITLYAVWQPIEE